jgi:predicted transcriptional regulator of viral defense system
MFGQALRQIAGFQRGYFRTSQALETGWTRSALLNAVAVGEIENLVYGLYRFAHYPTTPMDEMYETQTLAPEGTFSHETALALFGLSDILPRMTHLTIPPTSGFKPRPGLTVHHARLDENERVLRDGLWLTSVLRSLIDAAKAGIDPDQLIAAAKESLNLGLLSPDDLPMLSKRYPYTMIEGR